MADQEDDTPVNYGEVWRLYQLLGEDLERFMRSGLVKQSYQLRQVVYRYEEVGELLRKCNNILYEAYHTKKNTNGNEDTKTNN